MNLWFARQMASVHYNDLLREAEQERLARRALEGRPKNQHEWRKALSWLGFRLSAWGNQLQERYGTTAAVTTFTRTS